MCMRIHFENTKINFIIVRFKCLMIITMNDDDDDDDDDDGKNPYVYANEKKNVLAYLHTKPLALEEIKYIIKKFAFFSTYH
jgi:hypothetical protein